MWTAKTDRTALTPRLFWVLAGHIGHFVGFGLLRLKCSFIISIPESMGLTSEIRRGSEKRKVDTDRIIGSYSVLVV